MKRKRQGLGFTIMELLLGAVIASIVGVSVFGIFSNGIEAYKRTQFMAVTYTRMMKAYDALDEDIAGILDFNYANADEGWRSFKATGVKMSMVTRTPMGLFFIEYMFKPQGSTKAELRRVARPLKDVLKDKDDNAHAIDSRIVGNLMYNDGVELDYGQKKEYDAEGNLIFNWKKDWQGAQLPDAVRVTLRFKPYASRQLPIEMTRIFYLENQVL